MTSVPRLAGQAVAVPLGALARWRRGKPMHPRGVVARGVLERTGGAGTGVPWLDRPARDDVAVRLSRGAGLPAPWPDLLGFAVRVPEDGRPVDLLLSSTGRGALTRQVPVLRRDAAGPYSSIMGYRSPAGTLRLAAWADRPVPSDPEPLVAHLGEARTAYTLAVATGAGPWRPFAVLTLGEPEAGPDPDVRFDAVRYPPPGLVADGPMARFRAPAYARAQRERVLARTGDTDRGDSEE
ncbi:phosphodiesterase [Blastococcus sp. TF02A-26]|uniref:phosphodiesterase n=1 Tax=Blastococcus sp. TF02A-26 TaxID=2250577 RepID=UPI000DE96805|nr:phosphodiesterase [Blastococcus sp. TF02A-26]RBY82654.1 phosphodiesterase [Blastococcus sp. TF02A-26]